MYMFHFSMEDCKRKALETVSTKPVKIIRTELMKNINTSDLQYNVFKLFEFIHSSQKKNYKRNLFNVCVYLYKKELIKGKIVKQTISLLNSGGSSGETLKPSFSLKTFRQIITNKLLQ